jgi:hypothetical protein
MGNQLKAFVTQQVTNVVLATREKIIHAQHLLPIRNQPVAQV